MAKSMGWVAVGLLCLACGGGGGEEAPPPQATPEGTTETPEDDYLDFELDFKDDAVVLDDLGAVQAGLVRADYGLGEFVFAADVAGIDALEVDRATAIAGVGVFRVVGRETTEEGELVRVEPAPLTDVLENAHIAWRRSFVSAYQDSRIGLGVGEGELDNIGRERAAASSVLDGKLHYEGNISNFGTVFDLSPAEVGLNFGLTTTFKGSVGTITSKMSGNVRGITHQASLDIIDGVVVGYDELYYNVAGTVNFEVAAAKVEGELKIAIPARLSLPVMVGPIPFRIDLGSSLEVATTLQADSTAAYSGSVKFVGNAGARFEQGGGVTYLASFDTTDLNLNTSTQTSSVTAGFSTLLNFPELSIGVGVPELAGAVAYMRFKTEGITNGTILFDANGDTEGLCVEAGANFGASYGGNATFLGVKVLEAEKPLFGKIGNKRKSDSCR
jgi:hypothetical protein